MVYLKQTSDQTNGPLFFIQIPSTHNRVKQRWTRRNALALTQQANAHHSKFCFGKCGTASTVPFIIVEDFSFGRPPTNASHRLS
jgi:hypothetical protein